RAPPERARGTGGGWSGAGPPLYGAEPAAASTRPQLASRPNSAVFTSGEVAIRRAIAFASRSLAAPLTLISAVNVVPSPSATIWPARSAQTARRHSSNAASVAAERVTPLAPFASSTTVSFVEH